MALVAMALGLLAINLDFTVVNLGLAQMQRDVETSLADLQRVINAYTLVLLGSVVIAGRLGDALGRTRVYLASVVGVPPSLQLRLPPASTRVLGADAA